MKPRIETIAPGVTSEVIALVTNLTYTPGTGNVQVVFTGVPCTYAGDQYIGPGGNPIPISLFLDEIAAETFAAGLDPVTGVDLSTVSGAGVVSIIKAVFAQKYDAMANKPAPVEAAPFSPPDPPSGSSGVDDASSTDAAA